MANPNDFLLNTDYELDKIIYFHEGQFTNSTEFEHKLGFIPLVFGVWSTDENFYSPNPIAGEVDTSVEPGYSPLLSVAAEATATTVKLTCAGNTNNQVIYYRIYGFEPSDTKSKASATSKYAKNLVFDSDYNYCKLMKEGTFTQTGQVFEHKLGYIPQVLAWEHELLPVETIRPLTLYSADTNYGVKVSATTLTSGLITPSLFDKIYWRVYYDNA